MFWVNLSCFGGCHYRIIMNKALFDSYHQIEQGFSGELERYFHKKHNKERAACQNVINIPYHIGHLSLFEKLNYFSTSQKANILYEEAIGQVKRVLCTFWKYPVATTQGELDKWGSTSSCESLFQKIASNCHIGSGHLWELWVGFYM